MAGIVTEIQTITFDDLEQIPVVGDNDLLLVNDSDSNTAKKATKLSLIIDERDARIASDGYLQGQIDALAGTSGTSEKANLSLKGSPNGLAELDANGKVPASQLPSFVDDVIEGYFNDSNGKFYLHYDSTTGEYSDEVIPESGKVYTDLRTNLTYRWGGSAFVKIASDLALGETPTTAYRGDRGKTAYDHSQIRGTGTETATNPHGLSPADIGLGNVPNVTTNNQTPTYTESQTDEQLTSGETLSAAFGKLAKIVKSVIAHIANSANPHGVTKSQVGLGNVENVTTESVITSGSNNNITSGAVYTGLAGKLDKNGTAVNSQYAQAIGTSTNHPAIGSTKVPVYIDSNGEPKAITSLEIPTIEGNVTMTGKVTHQDDVIINGSADVKENTVFEKNVSIVGNLSVSGVTTVAEQESAIASDYLITRLNNLSGLAQGSHSGLAVNNYQNGKMATISADHEGTWRVADSATDTATTYTNISLFNGTYYEGLTHTETTGPTHIITNKQSLTLDNTVWYNGYYYYYNSDWKQIMSVTSGAFVFSAPITDTGLIESLEALTKETLLYYITVTDNYIDEQQNQPLLTRAEVTDLGNNHLLKWDSVHKKAVSAGAIVDTVASGNMQSVTSNAVANYVNFRYHDDDSQDADANTLTVPGVYSVNVTNPTTQHLDILNTSDWCVIYVTRVDNNPSYVQQHLIDWTGRKWTRYSFNGTWTSWSREVIHKDISVPVESGVTLSTMFSALQYQLNHTNFSFLLDGVWQTATGNYELQGYYYGQYTAVHSIDNNITVIGVIDWGVYPHYFSAYYSPNIGWRFEIDGQVFVGEVDGIIVTKDAQTGKEYFVNNYATTNIQTLYNVLSANNLLGRPMRGIFNWKMSIAHTYDCVSDGTLNAGSGTLNAGDTIYFNDPRLDAIDGTMSTWWIHWADGNIHAVSNLWGEIGSDECTWCSLKILT